MLIAQIGCQAARRVQRLRRPLAEQVGGVAKADAGGTDQARESGQASGDSERDDANGVGNVGHQRSRRVGQDQVDSVPSPGERRRHVDHDTLRSSDPQLAQQERDVRAPQGRSRFQAWKARIDHSTVL